MENYKQGAGPSRSFIGLWAHCSLGFIGLWAHCSLDRIGFWRSFSAHDVGEPPTSPNFKKICIVIFAKVPFAHIYIYIAKLYLGKNYKRETKKKNRE